MSLQSFSQCTLIIGYYLNQSFIALNKCENRNKPEMHCNGKCFLAKQMKKDATDQQSPAALKDIQPAQLYFNNFSLPHVAASKPLKTAFVMQNELGTIRVASVYFHPPS